MLNSAATDLALSPELLAVLTELGFTELTPIQAASIPVLLEGRDLIGQSKTGSGKTAAFALPILQNIVAEDRTLKALIICPTRELCAQVARETRRLARRLPGLQVLVVSGGQTLRPQAEALARGAHVVVGTPGRLLDHLSRGTIDLSNLRTLVLDEADRLLDMGFTDEVRQIVRQTPANRQTVLFSATFPDEIERLSRQVQRNPASVRLTEAEARVEIKQIVYRAETADKPALLTKVLNAHPGSALIFCNQNATINDLLTKLNKDGLEAAALHGDLEQRDRDQVLAMFRNGSVRRLVATDVAGRGLDVAHLDLVVNYDLTHDVDSYVHRIGRTGRAGRAGLAITLGTEDERTRLREFARAKNYDIELTEPGLLKKGPTAPSRAMRTLYISGGRKDKLRPGDILGALTGEVGRLKAESVGKIEIHDKLTYVAVAADEANAAIQRLRAGKIKGRRFLVGFPSTNG